MSRRGPHPQPASVKRQRASSRRPVVEDAPAEIVGVEVGGVKAPSWLKADGLLIWNRLAPVLSQAKLLTVADAETFGRYCRNFATWLRAQLVLDKDGITYMVKTASGDVHRPRPEFLIADRVERQLLAAEDRFGLNPAERQRIFAARAATPGADDLFGNRQGERRSGDPATPPAEPARPIVGPVGMLQ